MEINYTTKGLPLRFVGEGNSAIDVPARHVSIIKDFELGAVYYALFKLETGIAIEIPVGYNGLLKFRSGCGLRLQNKFSSYSCEPGLIDATFRGEMQFYVKIATDISLSYQEVTEQLKSVLGDYPLQLMIHKVEAPSFQIVESLSETWRGEGGFGSTGNTL